MTYFFYDRRKSGLVRCHERTRARKPLSGSEPAMPNQAGRERTHKQTSGPVAMKQT
jgi:hypothetical protein